MKIWRREGPRWERESKAIFDILRELPNRHANEDLGLYTVLWGVCVCVCMCVCVCVYKSILQGRGWD